MELIKAEIGDLERITEFYRDVVKNTEGMEKNCRWIYGKHPSDDMIRAYIEEGSMFYDAEDGRIIAAVAVTPYQGEDYHNVDWNVEAEDDEVSVVHLLCTDPRVQKRGIAGQVMNEVIKMAHDSGKKAVRLDALITNEPAQRLYDGLAFTRCGIHNWFTNNLGWVDFIVYEKTIRYGIGKE